MQNTCIFHWTRIKTCSKVISTRQFDHDCAKTETDTKGITSGYYVVLIGISQELGLKLDVKFLLWLVKFTFLNSY